MIFVLSNDHISGDEATGYGLMDKDKLAQSLDMNQSLVGRPKILILDCCRGDKVNPGRVKSGGKQGTLWSTLCLFLQVVKQIKYT